MAAGLAVSLAAGGVAWTWNVAVGAVRPLLKYFPLIALGQCFVVAGIIRGVGDLDSR